MSTSAVRTVAGGIAAGVVVGGLTVRAPELLVLAAVAVCGLLLGNRPALLLGAFLVVDQTYPSTLYFQSIGPAVTTGHQLYEPIKGFTPALLLLAVGLLMALHSGRGVPAVKLRSHGFDGVGVALLALLVWTATASLAQESVDFSGGTMLRIATNTLAAAQPWLLALLAYAVAIRMLREPGGRARFARVIAGALVLKGVIGMGLLFAGHTAVVDEQSNVVYYDAALPMVAGMAILAFLLATDSRVHGRKILLFLAGTIVVFSFRRSVWSAVAVGIVVLPFIRQRTAIIGRVLVGACVLLLALLAMPGSVKDAAFKRVGSAVSVAQGTGNEDSAENHKKDVERGFELAQEKPWLGLGVRARQHREFADQNSDRLYVHNDLLQVWLRLGLPGIALYLGLLLALAYRGVLALRTGGALSLLDAGSAAFAVLCIVPLMTAPFISDTARWPVLVAIAAAVLRTATTAASDAASRADTDADAERPARPRAPRALAAR